jgi:hypothetical protein
MTRSSSRLPADSTLANDSVEVNQTFGSPAAMCRVPLPSCETSSPYSLRCPLSVSSWNYPPFAQHRQWQRERFIWWLGGGLAGQFLAESLRHLEDEGFSFAVLFKESQVDEI